MVHQKSKKCIEEQTPKDLESQSRQLKWIIAIHTSQHLCHKQFEEGGCVIVKAYNQEMPFINVSTDSLSQDATLKNRKARLGLNTGLKTNLYPIDWKRRICVRKGRACDPKHTTASVKHYGGNVMAQLCMTASGTTSLVFINDVTAVKSSR